MKVDVPAKAWAEKVVDGLLLEVRIPDAQRGAARRTLLEHLATAAIQIAALHRRAFADLEDMFRAFHEAGGFDGLLLLLFPSRSPGGAIR